MFLKAKNVLIIFSTLAINTMAMTLTVSCSSNEAEEFEIVNITNTVMKQAEDLVQKAVDNNVAFRDAKIALFTAGGPIKDKSFNQSSYEVSKLIKKMITDIDKTRGNKVEVVPYNTKDSNANKLAINYSAALKNENIWIASGFQHKDGLEQWLKKDNNRENFIKKNILILGVDWKAEDSKDFTWPKGQLITLSFKTQENSYIIGYAAAKYLSDNYPNDESKRKLVAYGGGDFPGVTRYIYGFIKGAIQFNKDALKNNWPLVKWPKEQPNIELSTGFDPSIPEAKTKAINVLTTGKPQIVLDVVKARTLINHINTNELDTLIVGSADPTLSYPKNRARFFASVSKNIASSVLQTLIPFITKDKNNAAFRGIRVTAEENPDAKEEQFIFKADKKESEELININIDQGIAKSFVDTIDPVFKDQKKVAEVKKALDAGRASFNIEANRQDLDSKQLTAGSKDYLNTLIAKLINPEESASS